MTLHAHAGPGRRYQVYEPVGRGGFGTVYRADMLGDDGFVRAVALKVLNRDVAETGEIARRFRDEARVLGLLRHRAIVQVDGLVYLGDRQALVMEYIAGADLGRLMALGPIPLGPALEVVGEVANALDVAFHTPGPDGKALGLLHRDVKPSNIRLTPAGEVKVLDFGVARAEFGEREANTKSYLLGSNGYMGPERFEGDDGPATDIYSLGVVLLEMLTGKVFGPTSIRPAKLRSRIDDALAEAGSVSESVQDLVRQMMSFEPGERPTAAEVERRSWDLHRALDGERLRDWARTAVSEAAAKPVQTPVDDLSGQVLAEAGGGNTPTPAASTRAPSSVASEVPADPSVALGSALGAPTERLAPGLPPVDEWDDEQPTVVAAEHIRQLATAQSKPNLAAVRAPNPPPPPEPPAAPDDPIIDRTPLPRPRPLPKSVAPPPPSDSSARLVGLGTAVGAGLAVLLGALVVLSMSEDPIKVVPEAEPVEAPAAEAPEKIEYDGPMPTPREGAVVVTGDAPAVRLVSSNGQRHRDGLLKPGTYLVSADFGDGAIMAGRFDLVVGERVIVDCSVSARVCSVFRDD